LANLNKIKEMTITEKKASKLSPDELIGKIILGDFYQEEKPTYYDQYRKHMELSRKNFKR